MENDKLSSNNWQNIDANLPKPAITTTPAEDGLSVTVKMTYTLTAISSSTYLDMTYLVYFNGAVKIDTALRTSTSNSIYRFGVDMKMPAGFENIDRLTRGPQENLNDRMSGAFVGHYKTTVSDNYHSYIKPEDTGTRQDTRWMALTGDNKDMGLMIAATGDRNFEANALHFTWRGLSGIRHPYMASPLDETIVSVSYGSRGTGGNSCGPATLSQYQLNSGNMSYSYTLVPVAMSTDDFNEVARNYRNAPKFDIVLEDYVLSAEVIGDKIEAALEINAVREESKEIMVMVAVYNENESLKKHSIEKVTVTETGVIVNSFDVAPEDAGCTFKVFAWDAVTKDPLCKAISGELK